MAEYRTVQSMTMTRPRRCPEGKEMGRHQQVATVRWLLAGLFLFVSRPLRIAKPNCELSLNDRRIDRGAGKTA